MRLIVYKDIRGESKYRLVHDTLAFAVRKLSAQTLGEVQRASVLLNQRTSEYLSNQRHSRFLLPWRELRFITSHRGSIEFGSREAEKCELLLRSARRITRNIVATAAIVILTCAGAAVFELHTGVLRWRTQRDIFAYTKQISDSSAINEVVGQLASAGEIGGNVPLIVDAIGLAEQIQSTDQRNHAIHQLAAALVTVGANKGDLGLIDRGISVAERIHGRDATAAALMTLCNLLATRGETAKDARLFDRALVIADKSGDDYTYAALVFHLAVSGDKDRSLRVAENIRDRSVKEFALGRISQGLARSGEKQKDWGLVREAVAVADRISRPSTTLLIDLATDLAKAGDRVSALKFLDTAIAQVDASTPPYNASESFSKIAIAFGFAGERERALRSINRGIVLASTVGYPHGKALALGNIAVALAFVGDTAHADFLLSDAYVLGEEAFRRSRSLFGLVDVLSETAKNLVVVGIREKRRDLIEYAIHVADRSRSPDSKLRIFHDLAVVFARAGESEMSLMCLGRAAGAAAQVSSDRKGWPDFQKAMFRSIVEVFPRALQGDASRKIIDQADAMARSIADPEIRASALTHVAGSLALARDTRKALAIVHEAESAPVRKNSSLSTQIAIALARGGDIRRARLVVSDLPLYEKTFALASVLRALAEGTRADRKGRE